jgi:hypothetical protein
MPIDTETERIRKQTGYTVSFEPRVHFFLELH